MCFSVIAFAQTGFMENLGQFDNTVKYQVDYNDHTIYIDKEGFSVLLHDNETWVKWINEAHEHKQLKTKKAAESKTLKFQFVKFELVGANFDNFNAFQPFDAYYNYYLGNDRSKWVHGAKEFETLYFTNVYPNIDLEFQAIDQRFKYNFILNKGADIADIKIDIKGANSVKVTNERLEISTQFGTFSEVMPVSYSVVNNLREPLVMKYVTKGKYVGFEGEQNISEYTRVIDPELVFSTYSGSSVDNFGFTATFDSSGNLYAGGIATSPTTFSNGKYPITIGAFDVTYNGGSGNEPANLPCDVSISKYNSSGNSLLYATFLGGSSDEYPHSFIVDKNDNLLVFGTTYSSDFPTEFGAPFPLKNGGMDLFVTKFNANGSALLGSTYIGGSANDGLNQSSRTRYFYADDFRGEINLDTNGNVYVATSTRSNDFPITSGAFQQNNSLANSQEGVLFCLSTDIKTLKWSSYFGGSGDDAIYSVDVAADGDLYISGGTTSTNLNATAGSVGTTYNGGRADGFVARISGDGTTLKRTGYWGTSEYDQVLSLDIDKYGNIFVVGHSDGGMPVKGNGYKNVGGSQFITKFNPDLNSVLMSTVYGSGRKSPDITINAFLVDECGKIFVSGWGASLYTGPTSPLRDMPITPDAIQPTTDGNDFHLAVFRRDALELLYSTYFGGNKTDDHVDGGTSRFDKRGVIYQSVCSSCPPSSDGQNNRVSDFPTTKGAFSELNPSPRCSNASFKLAFGNLNRPPELRDTLYEVIALDTLSFNYTITDPDDDTINVTFTYPEAIKNSFINRRETFQGETEIITPFTIAPGCEHVGDTFTIAVYAADRGCPAEKDSVSFFKVVVKPPPVIDPPTVLCLNFINQNALKIEWEGIPPSKYFSKIYLHKIWPNGDQKIIDTLYTNGNGLYEDYDVLNPRERNYTYYLEVENKCGVLGPKSYDLSSVKESEFPIEPTYLETVTVEGKAIKVVFLKSNEDDFGHYEIYKAPRGKGEPIYQTSIYSLNDTIFLDNDVDVDNQSYCYQIKVSDNCGHLSALSNYGCSIVIRGMSLNEEKVVPRFKFDLWWDEYVYWNGGVDEYELIRSVDTGELRPIVRTNYDVRSYLDSDLDYDWGGYWYSVVAYEGAGSQYATSRSNDIYLIQPPLVFVPNAVTNNRDNLNDFFGWSDVFVREFEMRVYNRWGEKVFETTDKNAEWDGVFNGNGVKNSNVYVWVVTYKGWDNRRYTEKGTVTFVR